MDAAQEHAALTHGYLLIEPSTINYAPFLRSINMHPCIPHNLAHRSNLMPQMIDIAALTPSEQAQIFSLWKEELGVERPPVACAWIDTDATLDALSEHLARHLVGQHEGKLLFWRYYDPRVFSLTLAVLTPEQREALLGPIRTWQFAWAGHRWSATGPAWHVSQHDKEHDSAWPTQKQWERIERSEIITHTLIRLPPLSQKNAKCMPARLDRLLTQALNRGEANTPEELVHYAVHCVRHNADAANLSSEHIST